MSILISMGLLIYIPIAGLIFLGNVRERRKMFLLYRQSVALLKLQQASRGRLR